MFNRVLIAILIEASAAYAFPNMVERLAASHLSEREKWSGLPHAFKTY